MILRGARAAAALPAVLLVTWGARAAGANATAAGVLFLVLVVGLAAWGGWPAGVVASVAATVCLDIFFIPPYGRLAIADPGDVAALVSFLAAAVLSGAWWRRRAGRPRRRTYGARVEILMSLLQPVRCQPAAGRLGEERRGR